MKLVTYTSDRGPRVAAVAPHGLIDLNRIDSILPSCPKQLLAAWDELGPRAKAVVDSGKGVLHQSIELLPPIPDPEKIIGIGLNYSDHAEETGITVPDEPVIFSKFPTAVCADGQSIVLPRVSQKVDFEAELVVVIGRQGKRIPRGRAFSHVAAYTCGNDVSARDWQFDKPSGQWLLGKTFDGFAPFGPHLVTADELTDPGHLDIELRLNGQVMQKSNTERLIFPIDYLVEYVSAVCPLSPGDLIFTGTPAGVGFTRKPPVFLKPGDTVEVEIEQIGVLTNPVVAEET